VVVMYRPERLVSGCSAMEWLLKQRSFHSDPA
jgi:hypothetical protein